MRCIQYHIPIIINWKSWCIHLQHTLTCSPDCTALFLDFVVHIPFHLQSHLVISRFLNFFFFDICRHPSIDTGTAGGWRDAWQSVPSSPFGCWPVWCRSCPSRSDCTDPKRRWPSRTTAKCTRRALWTWRPPMRWCPAALASTCHASWWSAFTVGECVCAYVCEFCLACVCRRHWEASFWIAC